MKKTNKGKNNANKALLLATLALMINFWAWTLISPLGAKYADDLSLSPTTLSFVLAVPIIVGAIGRILLGVITDKFGGKKVFSVVCFLTVIPVVGLIFARSFALLVIVGLLLGLGGAIFAVGVPYVSSWFDPEKRGFVIGVYSMGNVGTAVSGFMTPRLVSSIGQNYTFLLIAGLLAIMGTVFWRFGEESPSWKPQRGSAMGRMSAACQQSVTWDLSAIYVITFGAFVAFGVYLPVLLKVAYGLTLTDAASRAAGFILLATVARPVGGWLSDKIGGIRVVKSGLLLIAALAMFVAFQQTLRSHTTFAYLTLAFVLGCCNGAVFALVGKLTKTESMGSVTGIIGAIGGLGGFLPPIILGLTYQTTNSYSIALIMLTFSALAVYFYISEQFRFKKVYKIV